MKKTTKLFAALMLSGSLIAPLNAYAWSDMWYIGPTQASNVLLWAKDKAEMLYQMAANQFETLAAIAQQELSVTLGMLNSSSAISATIEKQTGAMNELTQAKLNYDASAITARGAAEAEDRYGNQDEIANMCDAAGTGKNAASSSSNSNINGKALSASLTRRDMYTANTGVVMKDLLDNHKNYCSDEDAKQGRCKDVVPRVEQNADLNAGSLLSPANGSTYSDKEAVAAKDFIIMATNPLPKGMIQQSFEKTPQGLAYILATMVTAAQNSVAHHSLTQIMSANAADVGLSAATSDTPGDALSMVGVMKKFVFDRFADPAWKTKMVGMDTNGLLKEVAILLAGQNWMDYQAYLQAERMEAVIATQLAISAREHNKTLLDAARSNVSSSVK
jgi:hypothetical protein